MKLFLTSNTPLTVACSVVSERSVAQVHIRVQIVRVAQQTVCLSRMIARLLYPRSECWSVQGDGEC